MAGVSAGWGIQGVLFGKSCLLLLGDHLFLEEWPEMLSEHKSLSRFFPEVPDWSRESLLTAL